MKRITVEKRVKTEESRFYCVPCHEYHDEVWAVAAYCSIDSTRNRITFCRECLETLRDTINGALDKEP